MINYGTCRRLLKHLIHKSPLYLDILIEENEKLSPEEIKHEQDLSTQEAIMLRKQAFQAGKATGGCVAIHGPRRSLSSWLSCSSCSVTPPEVVVAPPPAATYPARICKAPEHPFYCVLRLFSGHRGQHDYQSHLERKLGSQKIPLIVLTIDTLNDEHWGDLQRLDVIHFWGQATISQRAILSIGGPPRDTWHIATASETSVKPRTSSPLRSSEFLWGLPCLTAKQQEQVDRENYLLRAHFFFLYAALIAGLGNLWVTLALLVPP